MQIKSDLIKMMFVKGMKGIRPLHIYLLSENRDFSVCLSRFLAPRRRDKERTERQFRIDENNKYLFA